MYRNLLIKLGEPYLSNYFLVHTVYCLSFVLGYIGKKCGILGVYKFGKLFVSALAYVHPL